MKALAREKITSIIVTHEMGFAQSVGDEMLFMYDGKIVESGPPSEIIKTPKCDITRKFFQKINELYAGERG